jgi:hypothetical protein
VVTFVPLFTQDPELLTTLEKQGVVIFTPSYKIGNQLVVSYDDR